MRASRRSGTSCTRLCFCWRATGCWMPCRSWTPRLTPIIYSACLWITNFRRKLIKMEPESLLYFKKIYLILLWSMRITEYHSFNYNLCSFFSRFENTYRPPGICGSLILVIAFQPTVNFLVLEWLGCRVLGRSKNVLYHWLPRDFSHAL